MLPHAVAVRLGHGKGPAVPWLRGQQGRPHCPAPGSPESRLHVPPVRAGSSCWCRTPCTEHVEELLGVLGAGGAVQKSPPPPWPWAGCHSSGCWDVASLRAPRLPALCCRRRQELPPHCQGLSPQSTHSSAAGDQGTKHWAGRVLLHSPANSCQTRNAGSFSPKPSLKKAGGAVALQDS